MSLLSVDKVTHRYPTTTSELPVLNNVSVEVEPGSVVAVVGESGCGKTTLGRIVVGLVRPMVGQVRYESKDIWSLSKKEWETYRRSVQVIHQDPYASLNPGLTVEDTLKAGLFTTTSCADGTCEPSCSACSRRSTSRPPRRSCAATRTSSRAARGNGW